MRRSRPKDLERPTSVARINTPAFAPGLTILLFDIDGTLIHSGGAGVRAMTRAFLDVFGVPDALSGISLPGRTDAVIISDTLARFGISATRSVLRRFQDRYHDLLPAVLGEITEGKRILPGVCELLEQASRRPDLILGLLTGNSCEAARIKLQHFNLWHYFRYGAYGDDAEDRNGLVPIALERAHASGRRGLDERAVFVIGDTPLDVACARAAGVRAIGVATGPYSSAELRDAGAERVFEDLRNAAGFFEWIDTAPR
jgi:phosphoglycolate phosphatase